jgi:MFS transporter, PAT family, beta-lactamase induction signal transducer AmpG
MSKSVRYLTFALLYFAQGAIMGYFTALNAIYLLSYDVSMSQIGLMGTLVMIPFVLKIFLGMLSDRVNLFGLGYRKPYIIIGLFLQACCLLAVPQVNPGKQFWLFAALAFLLQCGMALYDTCTDGLALDTTPEEEEGRIQGLMVGGRALGVVIVGGIGFIAQEFSWNMAFLSLVVLTLLPLPLVIWGSKESPRSPESSFNWKAFAAFRKRPIIALGLLGALYSLITNGANELVNPFLQQEFGISIGTAGIMTMVWGMGVALGGLTGGQLTHRVGYRRAVQWAMMIALVGILTLALIFNPWIAWLLVPLFGLAFGYYETVYFAISMHSTDPRIAASMFAILMAVANIGTGIGLGISGILADTVGFRWTFVILGMMNLLALPLLPAIFQKQEEVGAE